MYTTVVVQEREGSAALQPQSHSLCVEYPVMLIRLFAFATLNSLENTCSCR